MIISICVGSDCVKTRLVEGDDTKHYFINCISILARMTGFVPYGAPHSASHDVSYILDAIYLEPMSREILLGEGVLGHC